MRPWRIRSSFCGRGDRLQGIGRAADYHTALWVCKESVAKAMGTGISTDFRELRILGYDSGEFSCFSEQFGRFYGIYSIRNGFALAISVFVTERADAVHFSSSEKEITTFERWDNARSQRVGR